MSYDDNNIFAKILRGEIPCKKIHEDDHVLSFYDINPQKKMVIGGKYLLMEEEIIVALMLWSMPKKWKIVGRENY